MPDGRQSTQPNLEELNISVYCHKYVNDNDDLPVPNCATVIGTWIFVLIESFAIQNEILLSVSFQRQTEPCDINSCAQLRSLIYSAYNNTQRPLFGKVRLDMDGDAVGEESWTGGGIAKAAYRLRRVALSDSIVPALPSMKD